MTSLSMVLLRCIAVGCCGARWLVTSHRCRIRGSRAVTSDANAGKGVDSIYNRMKVRAFCTSTLHASHSSLLTTVAGRRATDCG